MNLSGPDTDLVRAINSQLASIGPRQDLMRARFQRLAGPCCQVAAGLQVGYWPAPEHLHHRLQAEKQLVRELLARGPTPIPTGRESRACFSPAPDSNAG